MWPSDGRAPEGLALGTLLFSFYVHPGPTHPCPRFSESLYASDFHVCIFSQDVPQGCRLVYPLGTSSWVSPPRSVFLDLFQYSNTLSYRPESYYLLMMLVPPSPPMSSLIPFHFTSISGINPFFFFSVSSALVQATLDSCLNWNTPVCSLSDPLLPFSLPCPLQSPYYIRYNFFQIKIYSSPI